jgi:hypothetical protein
LIPSFIDSFFPFFNQARCFCKRLKNPPPQTHLTPHSCGGVCGKRRDTDDTNTGGGGGGGDGGGGGGGGRRGAKKKGKSKSPSGIAVACVVDGVTGRRAACRHPCALLCRR